MSRPTPIPEVIITPNFSFDSETGSNIVNLVIDIKAGEFSNGFVSLDEPGDLHILRDAIDKFISNNNIKREDYMDKQIETEDDIDKLNSWRNTLRLVIDGIYRNNSTDDWHKLPPIARKKYQLTVSFDKIIAHRIGQIFAIRKTTPGYQSERSRRKDRTLVAKFMEVAKRELPKDVYKRLLEIAQEEIAKEIS